MHKKYYGTKQESVHKSRKEQGKKGTKNLARNNAGMCGRKEPRNWARKQARKVARN